MILIYSKDRAMQLHALLYSLGNKENIYVLYKTEKYWYQYKQLFKEFPNVTFICEVDLVRDTIHLLSSSEYVLFLTDDTIIRRDFNLSKVFRHIRNNNMVLGFSLRMGKNITHSHITNEPLKQPRFQESKELSYTHWDWGSGERCWGYPLTVDATAYRSMNILYLLSDCSNGDPGLIEAHMAARKHKMDHHPTMMCFKESVAFCTPVNIVRDNTPCPYARTYLYTIEYLAKMFDEGKRIDISVLPDITSAHQEIQFNWSTL